MKKNQQQFYPAALSCAGSDSGGGAGIQADLRTFNAFGVFAASAITAVTSQNPQAVRRIDPVPAEGVREQLLAVLDALEIKCAKTGMLFNAETVKAVARVFNTNKIPLVVDPVMVATSGAVLLEESAIEVLKNELFFRAAYLTPNIPEAELLLGVKLRTTADFIEAAAECTRRWQCATWLKTGHALDAKAAEVTDYLAVPGGEVYAISSPRAPERHASHGTGCTLSAALTATLALDFPWKRAVCEAKGFVFGSLSEVVEIGPKCVAMYPPEEDYSAYVKLESVKSK